MGKKKRKRKMLEEQIRRMDARLTYLELHCEVRKPKFVEWTRFVPLGDVKCPENK